MMMKKNVLVLLLDVPPLTKATLNRAFEPPDFEITWTSNVTDACEALSRQRFDLLLLDLNRPLRTAWGILERLIPLSHHVPIALLTEQKSHYEEVIAKRGGVVLQKPFSAGVLRHTVSDLLDLPSAALAPAAPQNPELSEAEAAASSDDFREMLNQRYKAPYTLPPAIPSAHRYWGLNE